MEGQSVKFSCRLTLFSGKSFNEALNILRQSANELVSRDGTDHGVFEYSNHVHIEEQASSLLP